MMRFNVDLETYPAQESRQGLRFPGPDSDESILSPLLETGRSVSESGANNGDRSLGGDAGPGKVRTLGRSELIA